MPSISDIFKQAIAEDKKMANVGMQISAAPVVEEKLSEGLFTQIQDMDKQLIHLQGQVNVMKEQSEHQTRMLEFLCMRGYGEIPQKPEKPKPKKEGERNIVL